MISLITACGPSLSPIATPPEAEILGARGSRPGEFSFPRGIDVAADGSIAVVDKTGRVQLLSPEGRPIRSWTVQKIDNGTPTRLLFDATDPAATTLLVADTHNSRILRYSLEGSLLDTFGEYGEGPGQMIYPTDIALDAQGNLYVSEYGVQDRVIKLDRRGRFLKQWGTFGTEPGQFQRPLALIHVRPDRLIVADTCNHRIQIFTTEGELIAVWGEVGDAPGQFNYPYDLALGRDGLLYVCEYGNNRIQCVDLEGKSRGVFGRAGTRPGEFGTPWGIAVAGDGRLLVADTNNHRLQAIEPRRILNPGE